MDSVDTLTVSVERDPDGVPVVTLVGQLDLASAPRAADALGTVAEPAPGAQSPIVIDVTGLTFMDSSGLTVLLAAVNRGHALRLRRPTTNIRRLIAATGLDQILPTEP